MSDHPVSLRRWLVLGALMAVTLACEAQWLVHAAVARPAAAFYAGQFDPASVFNIDVLALAYMVVFLVAALPASWMIDRWGLGIGVGIGSVLVIVGSVGKGAFPQSFTAQVGFQLLLALAQPFLINSATTVARQWFPVRERATAGGLASLSQYLGFVAALVVTPALVQVDPGQPQYGQGLDHALGVFAVVGVVAGLLALLVVRPGPQREHERGQSFLSSLRQLWASKDFRLTLLLFFLGLGMLNAITSLTDSIAASRGVKDSDGWLGVALIAGGVVGAIVLPLLSDALARRKAFLVLTMGLSIPALTVLFLGPMGNYPLAIAAMALLGLSLMSAGPIGFQYAAEITSQVPESASQGALLLVGQISGLIFTAGMSVGGAGGMVWWLAAFFGLAVLMTLLSTRLGESPVWSRTDGTPSASAPLPTSETP